MNYDKTKSYTYVYLFTLESLIIWNIHKSLDITDFKSFISFEDPRTRKIRYTPILPGLVDQLWIILNHFSYTLLIFLNKENYITYSIYPLSVLRILTWYVCCSVSFCTHAETPPSWSAVLQMLTIVSLLTQSRRLLP